MLGAVRAEPVPLGREKLVRGPGALRSLGGVPSPSGAAGARPGFGVAPKTSGRGRAGVGRQVPPSSGAAARPLPPGGTRRGGQRRAGPQSQREVLHRPLQRALRAAAGGAGRGRAGCASRACSAGAASDRPTRGLGLGCGVCLVVF